MFKQCLYLPIWLFELLTSRKSFRANPIIGSALLNRLGLHVVRLVTAHLIMRMRMWMMSRSIAAEDRDFFFRNGYLLKEHFLPEEELRRVTQEVSEFTGETRESRQGDTVNHRSVLEPRMLAQLPGIEKLFHTPVFQQLCRFTSGHLRPPLLYIETVKNHDTGKRKDPQKQFHSDTFHPTMKCWFFMHEVKVEEGPFMFIPGSQRLTWKRITWEYTMSFKVKHLGNPLAGNGSFRFSEEDLQKLDLAEPVRFSVKPNTLLFANTFGIHRRGDSAGKTTRTALWGDSRTNPFIPFPGVTSKKINELQYQFLADTRRRADEKAASLRQRSPWQVIKKDSPSKN